MTKDNSSKKPYTCIMILLTLGIFTFMKSYSISGNDFWWHIKAGEWMINNKSFPKTDMFSWIGQLKGLKWTAHEWLSEIVYYFIHHSLGIVGIFLFCIIAASALLLLVAHESKDNLYRNFPATFAYYIFFTVLCVVYLYGRPHVFSYFLLLFTIKAVYDFVNDNSKISVFFLPLIAVLWANFHGGSSNITYVIPVFAIITGLFDFKIGKLVFRKLPVRKLITLAAMIPATLIGICINPYGYHMLSYPYANMADKAMLQLINEWQSPDAKEILILICFFIPFALGVFVYIVTNEEINAFDLIIYAFFSYLFLRSSRFIMFLMIAAPYCLIKYIPKFGTLNPIKTKAEKMMACALSVILLCFCGYNIFNGINNANADKLIKHEVEKEFVDLIKKDAPKRAFTDYNYGGDLIYYGVPVFVDGRADVYTGKILEDASSLMYVNPLYVDSDKLTTDYFENLLKEYDFDAFLVPFSRPLSMYLLSHPEKYELVKHSQTTAYFKTIVSE